MTKDRAQHDSFTIERVIDAPVARVFAAWADPAAKARWFVGPPGQWQEYSRRMDFRVGGIEHVSGRHAGGMVSTFNAHYHDIVPDQRIIYAYEMDLDGKKISVSLATVDFVGEGAQTRMIFTEQVVFVNGYVDAGSRLMGTEGLMDRIMAYLKAA